MLKFSIRLSLDDHIQIVAALESVGSPAALALASRLNRTCLSVVRKGERTTVSHPPSEAAG